MLTLFRTQPRAFNMIFMLEIWERFGFYTVQGILTLFFVRYLGFDDAHAYYTFGAFSALVYGMVAIGGYLGDKVLGTKRTIVLGLFTLAAGYLSLAVTDKEHVFFALGLVCVGNGLFKANPSSLLSKCYEENDPRLHGAFTLYYMAINLGSTVSLFIGPALASRYGYASAYFLSFVGLLLGLANYWFQRQAIQNISTFADAKRIRFWQWLLIVFAILLTTGLSSELLQHAMFTQKMVGLVTVFVLVVYFWLMRQETKRTIQRMLVALVLMVEAVVFFTLYQQMPTSLNLFAVNHVRPYLLGVAIDPQSFQALNPLWIILLSPLLAKFYLRLHQKGISFSTPYKFAAGMCCCGLSFGLLYFACFMPDSAGMVSSGWLVGSYFLQSAGELLVSALGVAMVAELVPRHMSGFVMGMWFLTSSVAGFTGAFVASFTALPADTVPGLASLMDYTHVFALIGLATLAIAAVMMLAARHLNAYLYD